MHIDRFMRSHKLNISHSLQSRDRKIVSTDSCVKNAMT